MREIEVYNYMQSTYEEKEFKKFWSKGTSHRADVHFYTRAKSRAEALRKFFTVPVIQRGNSVNWVRERTSQGYNEDRLRLIITDDDAVYCECGYDNYVGKYVGGVWKPARIRKYRIGFRGSVGTTFSEGFFKDLLKAVRSGKEDIISAEAIDHDTFEIHTLIREEGAS